MREPKNLREQARRCRVLAKTAIEPEVIEQLRVWSAELADEADATERQAAEKIRWRGMGASSGCHKRRAGEGRWQDYQSRRARGS
jgi:predicted carbohydrate-binding protein with CBM5 and CBM33 domain